ncbi:MAG: mucoidy inhibitor MuiA family protein, partial [Kofleriaceae bacterium]|nr:mucoidy inhibitor MuiA family protein [Kofleriaceae bacterium]
MSDTINGVLQLKKLVADVSEVLVMEDRARVRRKGTIALGRGRHRLTIAEVAPVLADKTLLVSVSTADDGSNSGARVLDSRVYREIISLELGDNSDGQQQALALEKKSIDRELALAEAEIAACHRRSTGYSQTRHLCLSELAQDTSYGKVLDSDWEQKLASLSSQCMESLDQSAILVDARNELQEKLSRVEVLMNEGQSPRDSRCARIEIDVECDQDCELRLQVDYSVPGACWRPYHRAQLLETAEGTTVEVKTDACVWQNTGEDWNEIDLVLSTERASLGVEPPSLDSDTLYLRRKSSSIEIESRDQRISDAGPGAASKVEVPGIDDGGSVQQLRAPQKCSLPSDGKPHRIFLQSFESDAAVEWTATPELSPCVILTSKQENKSNSPLLAGPVDLIRESGVIGRSQILYVASGGSFVIGWGPESDIRLRRV